MNVAVLALATALGTIALFDLSVSALADDIQDYRWYNSQRLYPWNPSWNAGRSNCRVVEVHTTNRWGTDVTVHRRICD
jgi:hypothetical protein